MRGPDRAALRTAAIGFLLSGLNLFAMTTLRELAALSNAVGEPALAQDATALAAEVEAALKRAGA